MQLITAAEVEVGDTIRVVEHGRDALVKARRDEGGRVTLTLDGGDAVLDARFRPTATVWLVTP